MRCNWRRWLWGLIPLLMVGWVAILVERDRIQQDLSQRAGAALAEEGSRWASVEVEGRDVTLTGRAAQEGEPPRAEAVLRKVWGVREVENRSILPPKIEPFTWSARRRGNRIRLSGYVPDRATQRTVLGLTKAAMPGLDVADRMTTARGVPAPDTWLAGLSFALKQLSLLKNGDARFEDLALTISGEAEDPAAFKAINSALKSGLPKGIKLASAQIAAPVVSPFTWSAHFAGGQLVLAGHVAGGDKGRQELLAAAKAIAPSINAVDRMEPGEGAPNGWAGVAIALLKEVMRLESGTVDMKDASLTVGGIAQDEAHAQAVRSALRAAIPTAFTLIDQVRVREVKAPEPAQAAPAPQPKPSEVAPARSTENPAAAAPAPQPKSSEPAPSASAETPSTVAAPAPQPKSSEPAPAASTETSSTVAAPAPPPPAPPPPASKPVVPEPAPGTRSAAAPPVEAPAVRTAEPEADKGPTAQAPPAPKPAPAPPASPPQAAPATPPQEAAQDKRVAASPQQAAEPPPMQAPQAQAPATTQSAPKAAPPPKTAAAPPISPPQPPEVTSCQAELNSITDTGHILFATDSAKLDSSSFETLDRLAAAAKACPNVRIAIEGHTDAEGSAEYNQRLSVRRARAVVSYLVKAGADRQQLEAVGYGLTRPAAPNDTEENMARNRRIEFSVRQR